MNKATKQYQEIIDKLADMSKSCVAAGRVKQGVCSRRRRGGHQRGSGEA